MTTTESLWLATAVVLVGGLTQGSFLLPMRFARRWEWENIWLVYSVVGLLLIPWAAAYLTVPHLIAIYRSVSPQVLVMTALFGFGWGVANVLFGLAVPIVGMALSFAVVVGMSAALGSLIPLVVNAPERLLQPSGLLILAGVGVTTLGVVVMGFAGTARERGREDQAKSLSQSSNKTLIGLALCVAAGVLAPMLNFSLAFGSQIMEEAVHQGAAPAQAANAIWVVALAGGFVSNGGYCVFRLNWSGTWLNFGRACSVSEYVLSSLMGILFTGGLLLYGWGVTGLGDLGAAIGWPLFQATMILFSSGLGIAMGEWRTVEPRIFRTNSFGLAIVLAAIIILSIGNRM